MTAPPDPNRPSRCVARSLPAIAALAVLVAACGGDAAATAEALIETDLEEQIGLGELAAACDQPDELKEGETFECTAITQDGATIELVGELISDDEFNVQTTNLLTADDVESILPVIAEAVGSEVGADVVTDDLTCPSGSIILDVEGDFNCEISDTVTGDLYVITIQTGGLQPGGGPRDLRFLIGDLVEP